MRLRRGRRATADRFERAQSWLDERLGTTSSARRALRSVFPDHWSFLCAAQGCAGLGGVRLDHAPLVRGQGRLLMRQMHHWATLVLVAAIVVHLCRVFFTRAFRRPRELNWVIGVAPLLLALAEGLTGYWLPDDLLSGFSTTSATRSSSPSR